MIPGRIKNALQSSVSFFNPPLYYSTGILNLKHICCQFPHLPFCPDSSPQFHICQKLLKILANNRLVHAHKRTQLEYVVPVVFRFPERVCKTRRLQDSRFLMTKAIVTRIKNHTILAAILLMNYSLLSQSKICFPPHLLFKKICNPKTLLESGITV